MPVDESSSVDLDDLLEIMTGCCWLVLLALVEPAVDEDLEADVELHVASLWNWVVFVLVGLRVTKINEKS